MVDFNYRNRKYDSCDVSINLDCIVFVHFNWPTESSTLGRRVDDYSWANDKPISWNWRRHLGSSSGYAQEKLRYPYFLESQVLLVFLTASLQLARFKRFWVSYCCRNLLWPVGLGACFVFSSRYRRKSTTIVRPPRSCFVGSARWAWGLWNIPDGHQRLNDGICFCNDC